MRISNRRFFLFVSFQALINIDPTAKKQEAKNHRAAIEGTVHQIKHPFPDGKLPARGLFRVACLVATSAAMANVRRIPRYHIKRQKDKNHENWTEQRIKQAQNRKELPFSVFPSSFLASFRRAFSLLMLFSGC